MKEWKTRQVENGKVFVRLRTMPSITCKTMQETWGVRFDLASDPKNSRQSM